MQHDKQKVAALTAVLQLLQAEAEAAEVGDLRPPTTAAPGANLWGLSGRQAQMQLRNLLQLKAFSNPRLR
jgi:hypothetical protein